MTFKFILSVIFILPVISLAQTASEQFDFKNLKYLGTVEQQCEILLRRPLRGGHVEKKKTYIDSAFLRLITQKLNIGKTKLKNYLNRHLIDENDIGGSIDNKISTIINPSTRLPDTAKYFIFHDVSYEQPGIEFPTNIDSLSYQANQFSYWTKVQKAQKEVLAHVFVNRLGESQTYADFSKPCLTTKFENSKYNKQFSLKGLFLGVELVQPRLRPNARTKYYSIAPTEGFTAKQYERLAIIYIAASVRKGSWLIPAFHICIDELLDPNSHDDPQKFELTNFTDSVLRIMEDI